MESDCLIKSQKFQWWKRKSKVIKILKKQSDLRRVNKINWIIEKIKL